MKNKKRLVCAALAVVLLLVFAPGVSFTARAESVDAGPSETELLPAANAADAPSADEGNTGADGAAENQTPSLQQAESYTVAISASLDERETNIAMVTASVNGGQDNGVVTTENREWIVEPQDNISMINGAVGNPCTVRVVASVPGPVTVKFKLTIDGNTYTSNTCTIDFRQNFFFRTSDDSMEVGDTIDLKGYISSAFSSSSWTATDWILESVSGEDASSIISINNNGVAEGLAKGSVKVKAVISCDGETYQTSAMNIRVSDPSDPDPEFYFTQRSIELVIGESITLSDYIASEPAADLSGYSMEYTKSSMGIIQNYNVDAVEISNGALTAKQKGSVSILAKASGIDVDGYLIINVVDKRVKLNKTNLTLRVGESETLIASVVPAAEGASFIWMSDSYDDGVISVDQNGKVTALSPGEAQVAAILNDESSYAVCSVKVITDEVFVRLSGTSMTLEASSDDSTVSEMLMASVILPEGMDGASEDVTWSSSDESVVTVSTPYPMPNYAVLTAGKITGTKTAVITATSVADPTKKATCTVTVTDNPVINLVASYDWPYTDDRNCGHMYVGDSVAITIQKVYKDGTVETCSPSETNISPDIPGKVKYENGAITAVADTGGDFISLYISLKAPGPGLIASLVVHSYKITEGNNAEWKNGTDKELPFKIEFSSDSSPIDEYDLSKVTGVKVDGKALTKNSDYKLEKGSYDVILQEKYLKTLKNGTHNLEVTIKNEIGTYKVKGSFKVSGNSASSSGGESAKTEDVTRVGLGILAFGLSLAYILWYMKTGSESAKEQPALVMASADGSGASSSDEAEAAVSETEKELSEDGSGE